MSPLPISRPNVVCGSRLPKYLRLRKRHDFVRIQSAGVRLSTPEFVVLAMSSPEPATRLGITVTKKIGGAVVRVRLRRRIRELFRKGRQKLPSGLDLILIAKPHAKDTTYQELERAFDSIAGRLRGLFPCES